MKARLVMVMTAVITAACASNPQDPEDALQARASRYYDALAQQNYREVYGYFTPGYRANRSFEEHYQISPPIGQYLSAEVEGIHCVTEQACDVTVKTQFRFSKGVHPVGGMEVPMDLVERWVDMDGEWYLVPKR